jgi:phage terminase large subunit-like protein
VVSSAGSEAVDLAAAAGIVLDDWQRHVLEVSLGERADGTWAALEVGLIVPRQNGKNEILAARELAGIVLFGDDLITHSAHRADTTLEQFRKMEQLAEEFDEFARLVKRVSRVNGHEALELKGGRRIRFVSRQRSPGRGFSGSVVVLDEAFDLPAAAIGAMIPTLSTRAMAQVWYTSSPPHADSQVLHGVRRRIRECEGDRLAGFIWENPADVRADDRDAQYAVNPAMGVRISEDFIDAERELMADIPEEFLREVMGVPEEPTGVDTVVPFEVWAASKDETCEITANENLALDVSPDRRWSSFGVAGRRDDGRLRVEVVDRRPGTKWVLDRAVELATNHKLPIRVEKVSPAGAFIDLLREAGVTVVEVSGQEHAQATGQFIDAALNDQLRHLGQSSLDSALRGAVLRSSGDVTLWGRRQSQVDITPLVAVTIALGGVPVEVRRKPRIHTLEGVSQ